MAMLPRVQSFRKITGSGLAALLAISLTGCGSPVPVPVSYPLTLQPEMQSAAHWQMVAADMWEEISRRLKAGGYNETAIGLEPPAAQSQFSHAMDDFLFTEIVNHGVAVSPGAEFTITYNVQVLQYHDHDAPVVPGIFTGLAGAGALAGAGVQDGWGIGPAAAAGVPLAAAADFVNGWTPSDSQTEVILTFSVIDSGTVRIRESKVYYIPDGDAGLYQQGGSGGNNSKNPVLDSNWYAANPHDVDREVAHENNEFNLMIDHANGPLHNIAEATTAAVEHCASVGKSAARYIDQGFPENDRNTIRARFECE
jgi:hypothetical protein